MDVLYVRNWSKWQSYRSDRGQPPWIKVHRSLLRDPDFVQLTDAQRGQLVVIWLLAADRAGVIPASPDLVGKLCYMDETPDLQLFVSLGFLERRHGDATVTPPRRQRDRPEAETETEAERESRARARGPCELDDYSLAAIRGVYGWRGVEGTDMRLWNGQSADDRDRLLGIAAARLAAEGRTYAGSGRLFRTILAAVIAEDKQAVDEGNPWD